MRIQHHVSRETTRARLYVLGLALDLGTLVMAFALANLIVLQQLVQHNKPHGLVLAAMITPIYALLAVNGGAYGVRMLGRPYASAIRAAWALLQAAMATLIILYLGKVAETVSRLVFAVGTGLCIAGIIGVRLLMVALARRLLGEMPSLVVVIADGVAPPACSGVLRLDAAQAGIDPRRHDADMAARLAAAVGMAEQVIVACPSDRIDDWSIALKSLSARGEIIVPDLARFAPARIGEFDHVPTLIVAGGPLMFRDRIIKRLFDLALGLVAMILLSPVLLAAAVMVRLSGPGPVFFRQPRLGRDARPFMIYKFRTMRADASDYGAARLTQRDDPRVTGIGNFLRRTSIDELPQLFNVLKGDMSIVGPRPHAAEAKAAGKLYWEVDDRYWARHCIKPGMTGLAQVRGHRGATHAHEDLVNRLQSDLEYVTCWSIWRDVRIIVATAGVLLHPNAY